jgi:hypothetical protein
MKMQPKYKLVELKEPHWVRRRYLYTHVLSIVYGPHRPPIGVLVGRYHHPVTKRYAPNGLRECARRWNQIQRGHTQPSKTMKVKVDGPGWYAEHREFIVDPDRQEAIKDA